MTLRARLTAVLLVLMFVGLVVAEGATYTALRSFLQRRVDQQLLGATQPAFILLAHNLSPGGEPGGGLPFGTYVAAYNTADHSLIAEKFFLYPGAPEPAKPALPEASAITSMGRNAFSVGAIDSGVHYRVLVTPIPPNPSLPQGGSLVVAIPLREMTDTLHRLVAIALFVTLAVLAAMAVISWWTVRRGLRPLERIEQTAGAIAAGDLSQRVDETDPRTEVGRLGGALNVMLGRIEQAMDERLASEEALRRFLADASHELRTPLTSIRGYAELFRRGAADDPQDTALAMRRIEQESARMGTLVEDLLFLARAGEGDGQGRPIAHRPVDLARVAADAVDDARAVDPARPIALRAPSELIVTGDDGRLRQVFANLIGNAITHTPATSPVRVVVSAEDGWARLEVSDEGPGLSEEDASHIFDAFYRAEESRERVHGADDEARGSGAGLGLSIVAAIAQAHGGEAGVISRPGVGATFWVRIPVDPPGS
jgi:two-component system, OmpR family, sensor kinase